MERQYLEEFAQGNFSNANRTGFSQQTIAEVLLKSDLNDGENDIINDIFIRKNTERYNRALPRAKKRFQKKELENTGKKYQFADIAGIAKSYKFQMPRSIEDKMEVESLRGMFLGKHLQEFAFIYFSKKYPDRRTTFTMVQDLINDVDLPYNIKGALNIHDDLRKAIRTENEGSEYKDTTIRETFEGSRENDKFRDSVEEYGLMTDKYITRESVERCDKKDLKTLLKDQKFHLLQKKIIKKNLGAIISRRFTSIKETDEMIEMIRNAKENKEFLIAIFGDPDLPF